MGSNGAAAAGGGSGGGEGGNRFAVAPLRAGDPRRGATALTPEDTCLGCLIGAAVLLVSLAFWGFVYWRNAEELQPPPTPGPPVQQQIRDRTRPRTDVRTDETR